LYAIVSAQRFAFYKLLEAYALKVSLILNIKKPNLMFGF